ncbi:MAG: DUF1501 domain-containing protein [Dokdonella sp.]|uniref:DUF1501 domain-containing protein n=1 Tax=Dokdonella sp. TaxID=2291710 RepID=UPI003267DA41
MSIDRHSRRDFLRHLACAAASGGVAAMVPQLRMMGSALAAGTSPEAVSGYKALVCIYLAGGNDSWNMLVPYDQSRFDTYAASRGGVYDGNANPNGLGLARPTTAAQIGNQVITDSESSQQYFVHPGMVDIKNLYTAGHATFVGNMGTLKRPITKDEYNASSANRPPQLYSHSDQENLWHIGTSAENRYGWGGSSMARLVPQFPAGGNQVLSPCISISGSNKFEVGTQLFPYKMSSSSSGTSNPLSQLSGVCNPTGCTGSSGQRDVALNLLLQDTYQGMFASEYAKTFSRGRELFSLLYSGLGSAGGQVSTTFPANNSLASQLLTVARMIKLSRANNYAARQIYYVRLGSFDMHSDLMGAGTSAHAAMLTKVSQAIKSFSDAMSEIGAFNEVSTFTMSEFGRTLSSNGNGSDHGWGGIQMVTGGAVQGGRLYFDGGGTITGFPNQSLNNAGNFSRGQFIPGIGVDQYAATLARWLGVTSATDLAAIFPNLANFNASFRNLGFMG